MTHSTCPICSYRQEREVGKVTGGANEAGKSTFDHRAAQSARTAPQRNGSSIFCHFN
jgi:hypothetical protein